MRKYKVVASYRVPSGRRYEAVFQVEIHGEDDVGHYLVREIYDERLLRDAEEILRELEHLVKYDEEFFMDPHNYLMNLYREHFIEKVEDNVYLLSLKSVVEHLIVRDVLGYGVITPLLADEDVEDIVLSAPNTPVQIWHRKYPQFGWMRTNIVLDDEHAKNMISRLAFRAGKSISILQSVMEGILPEGYRVSATWMDEVSPRGSSFTIRKFRSRPLKVKDLVDNGSLPSYVAALLTSYTLRKRFIMIIGPSGSGKTTLLNALLLEIPDNMRVVTIEETPEINLGGRTGWKPLTTRWDRDPEQEMERLLRVVLRERADYIAVGESRGREARLVFQAAATGHGCLTTFHASTIKELQARLISSPLKIDRDMLGLMDAIVILETWGNEKLRRVSEVYLRSGDRWILVYKPGIGRERFYEVLRHIPDSEPSRVEEFERMLVLTNGSDGGLDVKERAEA